MDRSRSRGREQVVSTGRGGAGNFLRSPSRDKKLGIDESVIAGSERGRALSPSITNTNKITHAGRGGSGNVRAPSQDPAARIRAAHEDDLERELIEERRGREKAADAPFSTGRGGAGNIGGASSRSRSRTAMDRTQSRSSVATGTSAGTLKPEPARDSPTQPHHKMHAGGRGGFGNILEDKPLTEEDRRAQAAAERERAELTAKYRAEEAGQPHSSGKGGYGNIHAGANGHANGNGVPDLATLTLEEREAHDKVHAKDARHFVASGRGGAGNMSHGHSTPSPSGDDGGRGREGKHQGGGVIQNVLRSLSRARGGDRDRSR